LAKHLVHFSYIVGICWGDCTVVSTHSKSTFSDAHISESEGRCPLKMSQLVDDDQRLLMYTSLGMD